MKANRRRNIINLPFAEYPLKNDANDIAGLVPGINGSATDVSFNGNEAVFNGSTSIIEIPDNDIFSFTDGVNDTPYTITLDFKLNSLANQTFFCKRDDPHPEWQLRYLNGNMYRWQIFTDHLNKIIFDTNTVLNTNTYYNLKITSNGNYNSTKIYLNGVLQSQNIVQVGNYVGMLNTNSNIYIGSDSNIADYDGALKNLKFYNQVI